MLLRGSASGYSCTFIPNRLTCIDIVTFVNVFAHT
jgi:hypothetical protein